MAIINVIMDYVDELTADVGEGLKTAARAVMVGAVFFCILLAFVEIIGAIVLVIVAEDWWGIFAAIGVLGGVVVEIAAILFVARIAVMLLHARGESVHMLQRIAAQSDETEKEKTSVEAVIPEGIERWTCQCGKTNPVYLSSCSCGLSKRESRLRQAQKENAEEVEASSKEQVVEETKPEPKRKIEEPLPPMHKTVEPIRMEGEEITCPACNTVQPAVRKRCLKCGTFFEQ